MSTPTDPRNSEIGRWLESHEMGQYSAQFREHGISLEVLSELTDEDLKECGVTLLGHRKQILAAIRQLSATEPGSSAATPAVEETAAPAPRHVDHFELLEELGRGGIGIVYRAWDSSLNRQVAIKLLDHQLAAQDPKFLDDFVREARAAASINHPHIVQIYFAGVDHGHYYLVTELLEGQSMAERIDRGPMDEKLVLRIARQITEALAATNTRRLIHGDIKPQNIFLTKSGDAKLLDFGLARKGNVKSVEGGVIVGSIYYLSPERAQGQAEDFHSDIFSLGATLFHGLTGLLPFEGDSNTAMLRQRVNDDAPRLRSAKPDASAELDQLIARMMARDPADRYPSYDALLAGLGAVEAERLAAFDPTKSPASDLPPQPRGVPAIHPAPPRMAKDSSAATSAPAAATPETGPAEKRGFWSKIFVRKFLFISVVVHLIFGIGAACFVVQKIQTKRKVTFQGGPPATNPSKRALEHKVSVAQKKKTGGAPPQAKRIVSAGLAKVSLPDLPSVSSPTSVPGMTAGMGGAGFGTGVGFGSGAGGGMGGANGGGGGGISMFGVRSGGQGLAGAFYDLKQTQERKPTKLDKFKYTSTVFEFVRGGFQEGILKRFYQAPATLYAPMIMMPEISANEGPKAFGVEKDVQPSLWVALYEGFVTPPESGKYYFVGAGDDLLFVRFNGKLVFDRGWEPQLQGKTPLCSITKDYDYGWIKIPKGFARGEMFSVNAGQSYKIEILIGEQPGGLFSAALLLEKEGANYERDAKGNPILPVFRVANRPPPPSDKRHSTAPHMMDGPVWQVKPNVGIGRIPSP